MNADVASALALFESELQSEVAVLVGPVAFGFVKRVAKEIAGAIIGGTPVDTGLARGNWQVGIGDVDKPGGVINRFDQGTVGDPTGPTFDEATRVINGIKTLDDTIWLVNDVEYILVLEDGHSGQAPHGMVALALNNVSGRIHDL